MSGSFVGGGSGSTKSKVGKPNRPKRSGSARASVKSEYPITDSFASKSIPAFSARKNRSNPKSGFNCEPAGINKEDSFKGHKD
jgi:hypothetical protein